MKRPHFVWVAAALLCNATASASSRGGLYKTLGVSKDCSASELKKAYRKLSLKHHPDKVAPEKRQEAEAKFKEINEAYDTLSDDNKRTLYDQYGEAGLNPNFQQGGGFGGFNPNDFRRQSGEENPFQFSGTSSNGQEGVQFSFGDMFGQGGGGIDLSDIVRNMMGGRQPPQKRRPPPRSTKSYTRKLECTLEELANGVTKKLRVTHPVSHSPFTNQQKIQEKIYKVKIKPGWKSGTKVRFPSANGFPAMTFVITEKKHAFLERRGNDLWYRCKVTNRQAEKGAQIKIPLPDGEILNFSTKDEVPTKEGHTMTLRGKGMPIKGGPQRGNLIVEFHIVPQSTAA